MAFKLTDFKKTTRGAGEGRVIYPHQIRDARHTAAIGYAVAYFDRMVGRRRAEFETDALIEFFGDPRLARGLVACLADTYTWRTPEISDVVSPAAASTLRSAGVTRPADLRARLYGLANGRYSGFILPSERRAALAFLCEQLEAEAAEKRAPIAIGVGQADAEAPAAVLERQRAAAQLAPQHIERVLTLDAEQERVLVKLGATPTPEEIIARYNYHSLDTTLRQAEQIRLRLVGPVWTLLCSVHSLSRRYRIGYSVGERPSSLFDDQLDLILHGGRDALGGWGRTGRRLSRLVLRLLATHPGAVREGEALVHVGGKRASLRLDKAALRMLGAVSAEPADDLAWDEVQLDELQRSWGRALLGGKTAGWRLRRDPEPLVGDAALVVPDFAVRRGRQTIALCLAASRPVAESLSTRLQRCGRGAPVIVLAHERAATALRGCGVPVVTYAERPAEGMLRLVGALERAFPRASALAAATPWQQLEQQVAVDGFVDEATVAAILGCPTGEAAGLVRRWGGPEMHALPGLGVCDSATLSEVRHLLERAA